MKRLLFIFMMCCLAATTLGDWDPGDPYKMHKPQLPDPTGWDVEFFRSAIADDWLCTESGPVTDIHFWTSWAGDLIGEVHWYNIAIYKDVPANPDDLQSYSHPGELIVQRTYYANLNQFTVRDYGQGDQGFYDPEGEWTSQDHEYFQQVNIVDKDPLFYQERDTIYWLAISADWEDINQSPVGWKTSQDHFYDAAVYMSSAGNWVPLYDPALEQQGILQPLDLAFVITPEPATLALLGFGAVIALRRQQ